MRFFHTFSRLFLSLCLPLLNLALGPQVKKLVRSFSPPLYYVYYPTLVSTSLKHIWYFSDFFGMCYALPLYIYKWSGCPSCLSLFKNSCAEMNLFQLPCCDLNLLYARTWWRRHGCCALMSSKWRTSVPRHMGQCWETLEVSKREHVWLDDAQSPPLKDATWCDCILLSSRFLPERLPS